MSSGCGDVISITDLQTAKKHQLFEAEVITGKQGGVASGADIDYATNQVTGQTQKNLPAVLRDAGFNPASFDFTTGGTLGVNDRDKVVYDPVSKTWYSWNGALPHVIAAGTNPVGDANWRPQTDPNLRDDLAAVGVNKGANLVAFKKSSIAESLARTVQKELDDNATQFTAIGGNGNGTADNANAFDLMAQYAVLGIPFRIPAGVYATSRKFKLTEDFTIIADPGARIKYIGTATIDCLVDIDFTGGSPSGFAHGGYLQNLIIDGGTGSHVTDGVVLRGVVSGVFKKLRATNVTRAGMRLAWAQVCVFENYECSNNIETFGTIPQNGILADTASSSANTFINPVIEHVSGSGIKGIALINSLFLNGTSEGNAVGIELGEDVVGSLTAGGNTVVGMDLEVNSVADIIVRKTSANNDFIGLKAGFASGPVKLLSTSGNLIHGGVCGSIEMDANSSKNRVEFTKQYGATATLTDSGFQNTYRGVFNITNAVAVACNDPVPLRATVIIGNQSSGDVDPGIYTSYSVNCTGETVTINNPLHAFDGLELVLNVFNLSGLSTFSVLWGSKYKMAGWVAPAVGKSKTITFIYIKSEDKWFMKSLTGDM